MFTALKKLLGNILFSISSAIMKGDASTKINLNKKKLEKQFSKKYVLVGAIISTIPFVYNLYRDWKEDKKGTKKVTKKGKK